MLDYKLLTSNSIQGWKALSYAVMVDEMDKLSDMLKNLLTTLNNDNEMRTLFAKLFEKCSDNGYVFLVIFSDNPGQNTTIAIPSA